MKHRPGKARSLPPLPSTTLAPPEIRLANHSVMRAEWRDPDDIPTAAKTARTISGWRGYDPLLKCSAHPSSAITQEHILAADRLRQLADQVAIGYSGGRALLPVQSIVYPPSTAPLPPRVRSAQAWPGYRRCMALFDQAQRGADCACRAAELERASLARTTARWSTSRSIPRLRCRSWSPVSISWSNISRERSSASWDRRGGLCRRIDRRHRVAGTTKSDTLLIPLEVISPQTSLRGWVAGES
jgi:hypothetical protein